jgi:hypothetical protein
MTVTPSAVRSAMRVVLAGGPGMRDGGADAAAGARDLLVGGAGQAQLELARAVAAIDDMRVAVDEARRDPGTVEFVDGVRAFRG